MGSLPAVAIERSTRPNLESTELIQIAQAVDTNCRQTNNTTGVYQQPDLTRGAVNILPAGQTVRLGVVGAGTGWSNIVEPIVGWVESQYLTPPTPCTSDVVTELSRPPFLRPDPSNASPTGPIVATPLPGSSQSSGSLVCVVQNVGRLTVLSPTPSEPPLPNVFFSPGESVAFQFTGATRTISNNVFAYIVAPYEGWIRVRDNSGTPSLSGNGCP